MNVYILSPELEILALIDNYYSLTWVERQGAAGEFELDLPIFYDSNPSVVLGNFVMIPESESVMIIEGLRPTVSENTSSLLVTGPSSEAFLRRRFTRIRMYVDDDVETILYSLMNEHIISPEDTKRKMDIVSDTLPIALTGYLYKNQLDPQSLYDIFTTICKATGYDFRFKKVGNKLAFYLYRGVDRSASQSVVPRIIFSENFDNVVSSSYYESDLGEVNLVNVITDDSVYPLSEVWTIGTSEPEDVNRRETTIEISIDREVEEGVFLSDADVWAIIQTKAHEVIFENKPHGLFEGDFDVHGVFKYGVDYFLGDIVHVVLNSKDTPGRITELVRTYSVENVLYHITVDFIDI